jgi:hypothetical protein
MTLRGRYSADGDRSVQCLAASLTLQTCSSSASISSLDLRFDEDELVIVRVDDIVLHASLAEIGQSGRKLDFACRIDLLKAQPACNQRNDDVIEFVLMPACAGPRLEPPLGDPNAIVLDEDG